MDDVIANKVLDNHCNTQGVENTMHTGSLFDVKNRYIHAHKESAPNLSIWLKNEGDSRI